MIGNSAYQHAGELKNPRNDAMDMSATLKALGLEVIEGLDLDKNAMDLAIRQFSDRLEGAKLGLFFFAGHGLQVSGVNYLVPVDAKLSTPGSLDFEAIRAELVQRQMELYTKTNVIFLDACRDNPLARNLARSLGTRSSAVGQGLRPMEAGEGTLIGFSTQPGNVALDGEGRNSPFTTGLVKHLVESNEDLSSILISVRRDVKRATNDRQVPWEHSSLTDKVYFRGPAAPAGGQGPGDRVTSTAPAKDQIGAQLGIFSGHDGARVNQVMTSRRFMAPKLNFDPPGAEVSTTARRFIGVWASEIGFNGGAGRQWYLIVTRVDNLNTASGSWGAGPPTANSLDKTAPNASQFSGTVAGDTLTFTFLTSTNVNVKVKSRLVAGNRMHIVHERSDGHKPTITLEPIWTLAQAEGSAKR